MDDSARQLEEKEALIAIYGDDFRVEDYLSRSYSVSIFDSGNDYVTLYLTLPVDYPSKLPPQYDISAPHLQHSKKIRLYKLLDEVYSSFVGETVIYQWIEKIRDELHFFRSSEQKDDEQCSEPNESSDKMALTSECIENCPTIYHGEVIVDRKSSFQGHAASVSSVEQVKQVLSSLLGYRKIEQATHNIYAYRIFREDTKSLIHDCDDDGESQAGGRLLHLLEIVDAKNVLIVVSRWYGGIHLGPDRFRHINNAARQVLESSELIKKNRDQKK
ncbi:protein IMPACT-A-like [Venturia canescens]|uniref:protein IMPACT-A-like n=1 Tax=Venturia canescens TaxID=32260 RepID=UPI001C9C7935|nr:protein IMPACT-A-like [Venturia canescens]